MAIVDILTIFRSPRLRLGVGLACCVAAGFGQTDSTLSLTEFNLGSLEGKGRALRISPDGKRYGYISEALQVRVDRVTGADLMAKQRVVVDGKLATESFDSVMDSTLLFSPDSKHFAYAAKAGDRWQLVVDDKADPAYDGVGAPVFSRDSQHVIYSARQGGRNFIVVDGKPQQNFDGIGETAVSSDGKRLAYIAMQGGKGFVVIDGKADEGSYDGAGSIVFSEDGKHVAYAAVLGGKSFIVADGTPLQKNDGIVKDSLRYSPDGRSFAYAASSGRAQMMILDGNPIPGEFDAIARPIFSPDGKRLAYAAKRGPKWLVVVDGKQGPLFDGATAIAFSQDSQHIAYLASTGGTQSIVLDGQQGVPYYAAFYPAFGPDSQHMAYLAHASKTGKWLIVVDGKTTEVDYVFPDPKLVWDDPVHLHMIAGRNTTLLRLDVTVSK